MAVRETDRRTIKGKRPSERKRLHLAPHGAVRETIPPLENGDRLTRQEFERRYEAMPQTNNAQLIEGVVHMPSPVHLRTHAQPHSDIITWLGHYRAATPGVYMADNATVRLDPENMVQPDALLRLEPALGGKARVTEDDYLEGPPELVVEIASSSASYDVHEKMRVYRRNQVQEYLVWQVRNNKVDWFRLREGDYAPLEPDRDGVLHSEVFPGLRLDVESMLTGNLAQALVTLQKGLKSKEHVRFVDQLTKAR